MEEKEIYRTQARVQKTPLQTALGLVLIVLFCLGMFALGKLFPFGWIFEAGAIIISAILINKLLKQGTFTKTYVLFEDRLIEITRYGLIEKETGVYYKESSRFTQSHIIYDGKKIPFYPDEKLSELLN